VVDIVNADEVDDQYYRLIQANTKDIAKSDSEGDYFMTLHSLWSVWEQEEKDRKYNEDYPNIDKRWVAFLDRHTTQPPNNPKRYLQLLGNGVWKQLAYTWCEFAFGRSTFRVHQFTDAAKLMMDEVSQRTYERLFILACRHSSHPPTLFG
jgi:hypothetical protein